MTLKFAAITASVANFTTADSLIGVQNATADRLFSLAQIAAGILTSPIITGHATIEGVLLSGATGTGAIVLDHLPTIGTATINNSTLGTATINNSSLGTATVNNSTLGTATINNSIINTAVINTSTLNTPTINTAVLNAPLLNTAALVYATINTATINNETVNTATINNATLNTAVITTSTINNATIGTATINNSTIATATINNSTINTAVIGTSTINNSTIGTATINNSTLGTATISNSSLGTATINNSTLNTATINVGTFNLLKTIAANQLGSAVDTTSLTSTYNRYRITFENVCPVSTATLTCSLNMQVATSGTSWINANYAAGVRAETSGGGAAITGTASLFCLSGDRATTCVGTSTLYGVNGWVEIVNPANTIIRKGVYGHLTYVTPGAVSTLTVAESFPYGFWDGNSNAIVSLAVAFQTGNIATGTIRIYGII